MNRNANNTNLSRCVMLNSIFRYICVVARYEKKFAKCNRLLFNEHTLLQVGIP